MPPSADEEKGYGWYRDDQWTEAVINKKVDAALHKNWSHVGGVYGPEETNDLFDTMNYYKEAIIGKRVLVVGSETPWVESLILAVGAEHVTTMDYNQIHPTHPKVL